MRQTSLARPRTTLALVASLAACAPAAETSRDADPAEDVARADDDGSAAPRDDGPARDAARLDEGAPDAAGDARADPTSDAPRDAPGDAPAPTGVAPDGVVPGERRARDGANAVGVAAGAEVVLRVDARAGEHVAFDLRFSPSNAAVVLQVDRWTGAAPRELGRTDGGAGLRVLAVVEAAALRTHWARVRAGAAGITGTLTVTRTPYTDAPRCGGDCARLMQFPLPVDPRADGYNYDRATVFRYQFARRDLLMFTRQAGRDMVRAGHSFFVPQDFSQWDGLTPGSDTGSLRHASHQRGKDVDLSLYGTDGEAPWRSYCTTRVVSGGRECVPGTARGFDGAANARMLASLFATGRVTMCFLDRELIPLVRDGARAAGVDPELLPLYADGVHLQHWPNHDNHVHVRVSESASNALTWEPFEAP